LCSVTAAEKLNASCLLQHQKKADNVKFYHPSTVIVGICDSGTRGVEQMVVNLGFKVCQESLHESSLDNDLTKGLNDFINPILEFAEGSISDRQLSAPNFSDAVATELAGAAESLSCILGEDETSLEAGHLTWGYKNPDHIFLLPVIDAAFEQKSKYLIVARDPRDSCTAHNRGQLHHYGTHFLDEQQDCWQFWAKVWDSVLNTYEHDHRVKVVRVEDLVMPDPTRNSISFAKLQQVVDFMNISPTEEEMIAELQGMHAYQDSYMGHHYNMTDEDRQSLLSDIAARPDNTMLFKSMRRLGYSTSGYEVTTPECPAVI